MSETDPKIRVAMRRDRQRAVHQSVKRRWSTTDTLIETPGQRVERIVRSVMPARFRR